MQLTQESGVDLHNVGKVVHPREDGGRKHIDLVKI